MARPQAQAPSETNNSTIVEVSNWWETKVSGKVPEEGNASPITTPRPQHIKRSNSRRAASFSQNHVTGYNYIPRKRKHPPGTWAQDQTQEEAGAPGRKTEYPEAAELAPTFTEYAGWVLSSSLSSRPHRKDAAAYYNWELVCCPLSKKGAGGGVAKRAGHFVIFRI